MRDGPVKVTLQVGSQRFTGPVQGAGGMMGAGVADPAKAVRAVRERLAAAIERAADDPTSVLIFPDYSVNGNGEPVSVRLAGACLIGVEHA